MKTKVSNCSRCGSDHEVVFEPLKMPSDNWTHWARCPETGQPIMMRMVEDQLELLWEQHGGSFHGPIVETATMPKSKLIPWLQELVTTPAIPEAVIEAVWIDGAGLGWLKPEDATVYESGYKHQRERIAKVVAEALKRG